MRAVLSTWPGRIGAGLVAIILILAIAAPVLAPYDPEDLDVMNRFAWPSAAHWLGTDQVGRDLCSRVIFGTQIAVAVALAAITLALVAGVLLGVVAAFAGGWAERILLVLFDTVAAFPSLILALAVVAVFGPSTTMVVFVVAATLAPQFARVARAQTLVVKSAPFLDAERILGARGGRIMLHHLLPNIAGPLIVLASMDIPNVITIEAGLSFIGLGVRPPLASLGTLINDGYSYLSDSAWPVASASGVLALATLGFTLFGEAVRDAADPRHQTLARLKKPSRSGRRLSEGITRGKIASEGSHHDPLPGGGGEALGAGVSIHNLTVRSGAATILHAIDLDIPPGVILGIVGESGSGKSTLANAIMGLLPAGMAASGDILFAGQNLVALPEAAMQRLRGDRLAMIFQDPMTSLNPLFTIGAQLTDVLRRKDPRASGIKASAITLLTRVGIADPAVRLRSYPHELSGGMRQRVAIAMALAVEPALLLADEPTTALDATVEAQIAALFRTLRSDLSGSIVFISHQLGLVAQLCDTVCVLYGGVVVETGPVGALVSCPQHPYTKALLACEIGSDDTGRLHTIPGEVPSAASPRSGCIFASRCPNVMPHCRSTIPPLATKAPGQRAACILVPNA